MASFLKRVAQCGLGCVAIALSACEEHSTPVSPDGAKSATVATELPNLSHRPQEEKFVQLASEIAGFGGFFFDESGNLVAYVTDLKEAAVTRAALEPFLRGRRANARNRFGVPPAVVVRQGKYGFSQLKDWRDRMTDAMLNIPGVTFTDLEEDLNRLAIGILNDGVREQAEAKLAELGVPLPAVSFTKTGPIRSMVDSLSLIKRPLEGGRLIFGYLNGNEKGSCTLGFPAMWSGRKAFITASHCTALEWGSDGYAFYQPRNTFYRVGQEVHDPRGWSCGFLLTSKCRNSDAAVIAVDDSVSINLGYIAQTCADTRTGDRYHIARCQDWVAAGVDHGDSGAPVFKWNGDGTVALYGLLWGAEGDTYPFSAFIFSSITNIEADLGALTTVAPAM